MDPYKWKGREGPFFMQLPPNVFQPTYTSTLLAKALEINAGDEVIDVGCGCGVLGIVAAMLGAGRILGIDNSEVAVETARSNASSLGFADVAEFWVSNLFDALPRETKADVVIGDVSGIPDALAKATGWYPGGPTGAELPMKMLRSVRDYLTPSGCLYLPTGTIQADWQILDTAREVFGKVKTLLTRNIPLQSTDVLKSDSVAALMSEGVVRLKKHGSRFWWQLSVHRCSEVV